MNQNKIILQHKVISKLISEKKIKQSLDILEDMIAVSSLGNLRDEYNNIVMTYKNMLSYTIEGINDPERPKIYLKLIQSIYRLADQLRQDILSRYSGWHTYWVMQQTMKEQKLSGKTLVETVDDLMFKSQLDEWLGLTGDTGSDPESDVAVRHRQLIGRIFNHLWLADYYGEAEHSLIRIILDSGKFSWYETSIFVSAISLSAFRTFQAEKIFYLLDFYSSGQEKVIERALTGLVFCLHYYNDRIIFYPEIISKITELGRNKIFREHVRLIVLQIIRSRETENLSKRLHDEILPRVAKLKPRIEEKLDLDNILPGDMYGDKNPDWSDMFKDSEDIFKTMEELTKLQMEGADVYMSAFSNLKHFDFFKDFQNWFMPFHPDHEILNEIFHDDILGSGTDELAEALYKTPFICNSDKYSLLLNLKYLPSSQKTLMLKVFRMELDGLQQLEDNENISDPFRNFRINSTQYIQDIYRFFKLSPYKKEFEDLFSGRLDIYNSEFFRMTGNASEAEAGLADYFFNKNYYSDALELFLRQANEKPDDSQLHEKIAFCYQQEENYEEALKYYQRADLIERKLWTLKKIGLCFRRLGKKEDALDYYLQAGKMDPDDIHTIIMIGHSYLDLHDYETALSYYFRVEYHDPGNLKILRPIAFCYFALGRFEDSQKYFEKLSTDKLTAHDYINRGHLALCEGRKKEAVDFYRLGIGSGQISQAEFMKILEEDRPLLVSLGVNAEDLPILMDYLLFTSG